MSQINEGDLQAYLDGAYEVLTPEQIAEIERLIEEDEAFAAQVEEARAVRAAASSILGDAVPEEFAPPPFEELQRRAAAAPAHEKPEKRRWVGVPPLVGMGWAATVVLALGVGWYVGQGAGDPQFSNSLDSQPASSQADIGSRSESELQGREADAPSDLVGRTFADADGEPSEKKAEAGADAEFEEEAPAEPPAAVALDEVVTTGSASAADERFRGISEVEARDAVRGQAVPPGEEPEPSKEAQEIVGAELAAPEMRRANEADELARSREDVAQVEQNAGAVPSRDARLLAASEEHAYHSLALPGLEVLSVTLDEAGALSGLMILHQLPAGDTLELRYVGLFSQPDDPRGGGGLGDRVETEALPALSAQLREAALPPGWRQVVVRKENRWVVARAPISEAQIRAYLMTLN